MLPIDLLTPNAGKHDAKTGSPSIHLKHNFQTVKSSSPGHHLVTRLDYEAAMSEIIVATFNTWNCQGRFPRRLPLMIAGLERLQADVILLQEVFAQAPTGMHVGERLADALGMVLSYVPARTKVRKLNSVPILSHSGLGVLSKSPIMKSHSIRLPQDERDGERLGQCVTLNARGVKMQIGNVHLTHLADCDGLRRQQLQAVVAALDDDADLTLIGGDMNAPVGHSIFEVLEGFGAPCFTAGLPTSSLNPVNGEEIATGVIDHVFARIKPGRDIAWHARLALDDRDLKTGLYPSDHKALVVRMKLK